jgi:hypothetical protein
MSDDDEREEKKPGARRAAAPAASAVRLQREDALSRKWGINTGCLSGVVALSGGGEVAVVGGRSGSFFLGVSYEREDGVPCGTPV